MPVSAPVFVLLLFLFSAAWIVDEAGAETPPVASETMSETVSDAVSGQENAAGGENKGQNGQPVSSEGGGDIQARPSSDRGVPPGFPPAGSPGAGRPPASDRTADPLEGFNRTVFAFNRGLEIVLIRPAARGWRKFPLFFRDRVRNLGRWLSLPLTSVNSLLQGDLENMAESILAFGFNGTIGVFGLFDFAGEMGIKPRKEDFGQTLAVYGLNPGAYIVLPVFGPSSLRDAAGRVVDYEGDALLYENTDLMDSPLFPVAVPLIVQIDNYARLLDRIEQLEANSLDYYSAVRSFHNQSREAAILNVEIGRPQGASGPGGPNGGQPGGDSLDLLESLLDEEEEEEGR